MHFGINNNDIDELTDASNQLHNGDELTTLMDSVSASINDGSIFKVLNFITISHKTSRKSTIQL